MLTLLTRALTTTQEVVGGVRSADLDLPTPCAEYDVRRLLEHVIGWQVVFAACAADEDPSLADGSPTYVLGDPVRDLRAAAAALTGNLGRRADESINLPYRGTVPVTQLLDELVAETVIHTWDLAAGLRRSVEFDSATIAAAQAGLTMMLAESFAEQGFRSGGERTGADELEALLVRSGRDPEWSVPR